MQKDTNTRPSQGFTNSGKVNLWRFGRVLERKKNNSFQGELSSLVQTRKCTANRRWACTLLLQTTCYFVFFFQMLCRFFNADISLWRWDTLFGDLDCPSWIHLTSQVYFVLHTHRYKTLSTFWEPNYSEITQDKHIFNKVWKSSDYDNVVKENFS